ncbi:MAG: HEAT repeat domain-containing protein [Planctomycetaceae bacterium]|nr:HEAT repeat domain-containing protein [Planctomycetaceae bacterium]MCA9044366.1 HEAT repeat domain-containing protein [Planctomycetaceae bacterium]MCB9951357.1 HEAT repeat domain-containing protein [Planctomycetaceae bacterium]
MRAETIEEKPAAGKGKTVAPIADDDWENQFAKLGTLDDGESLGQGKLIECDECGEMFGRQEEECVHCGEPNAYKEKADARKKKRKKQQPGALRTFYEDYEGIIKPGAVLLGVAMLLAFAGFLIIQGTKTTTAKGRPQKEFGNRTSAMWIQLEREGKARRVEILWQDQRWMPLEQYLGLDWAAVPDWFGALTDVNTRQLAESVLGRYSSTGGSPFLDDIQAGLQHESPLVRVWAIRLSTKLEDPSKVALVIEKLADDSDPAVSEAAKSVIGG